MKMLNAMKNRYEKVYQSCLSELEFNNPKSIVVENTDTKDLKENKYDFRKEKQELKYLCIDAFDLNKEKFKKNKLIRNIKMFFGYDVPLIGLAIASSIIITSPKRTQMVPVYNVKQTMICDDKIITDIDDSNYFTGDYDSELQDNGYTKVNRTNTEIQYQVKCGTTNVIVQLRADSTGALSYTDSLSGNFFDRNAATFKDIEPSEIEAKYQELVNDIDAFIANDSNVPSAVKKQIDSLLEDNKTMVITTIVEYFQVDEVESIENNSEYRLQLLYKAGGTALGLLVYLLIFYLFGGLKLRKLDWDGELLVKYEYDPKAVIPFKTAKEEKQAFIRAETTRRAQIQEFVNKNLTESSRNSFLTKAKILK